VHLIAQVEKGMISSQDSIINELKARVKIFEKQNELYAGHMEEKLLLWLVSESIKQSDGVEDLLSNILERISVILDIPVSACCRVSEYNLLPVKTFNILSDKEEEKCSLEISNELGEKLNEGPIILDKKSEQFNKVKFTKGFKRKPQLIAMFPFQSLYIPFGVFVFIEDAKGKDSLTTCQMVIQQLINMAVEKLEKLSLLHELKELNYSFDDKLRVRTEELQSNIEKLTSEIEALKKQPKSKTTKLSPDQDKGNANLSFLKNIGVEVRAPLNAILGFSEIIRDDSLPAREKNNFIDIIKSCGKSLMKIVDDSYEYATLKARDEVFELSEFALTPFMTDIYDQYKKDELFKQRESLVLKLNINLNGATIVFANQEKLKLILTNLIGNAIKITENGFVEFGCFIEGNKDSPAGQEKMDLKFFIKDTGVGISDVHTDNVFDEFFKVEHEISKLYGGLGLGLTIAKELVEKMGGKIWFESREHEGSEFYFIIPECVVVPQPEVQPDNRITDKSIYNWEGKKILIVEDDAMSFVYLKEVLKFTNVQILHATDGKKAIEMAAASADLDLILMDIKLPGISGYDATRQIKSFSDVPVIAQTAYAMADDYKKIIQVGCDDYISKPLNRRNLLKKIDAVFKKRHLSSND